MREDHKPGDAELLAALEWYRAAGVDIAVTETPADRFAAAAIARARPAAAAAAAAIPAASPAPEAGPAEAAALAARARSMDELREIMAGFDGCGLKLRATQLCFADGNPEARIMLVGEAPGSEEDRQGKPFVGRAGQLLDRMLGAIGLDRSQVFIVNTVPWRPPGNREPSPEELLVCRPFLFRQIELVAPSLLVTLGNVPTKALFETTLGITRMRGQWKELTLGNHTVKAMATLHPAYLLRQPASKQLAWRDMLSLKQAMDADPGATG